MSMKRSISALAVAALLISVAGPALAQDDRHHDDHRRDHQYNDRNRQYNDRMHQRQYGNAHRFHEGQNWNGHRVTNRGGHWGYYQPQNGSRIFINIPL